MKIFRFVVLLLFFLYHYLLMFTLFIKLTPNINFMIFTGILT